MRTRSWIIGRFEAKRLGGRLSRFRDISAAYSRFRSLVRRAIIQLSRGVRVWEITSSRCYLASYVSRSLPASADGALLVADFAGNSAKSAAAWLVAALRSCGAS